MNESEHNKRTGKLQNRLAAQGLDGALLTVSADIYYFAGTRQNSVLWIPSAGSPVLLVRKSLTRAKAENPGLDIRPFSSRKDFAGVVPGVCRKAGFTFNGATAGQYKYYAGLLAGAELADISALIRELRSVKSETELACLRESAGRLSEVFSRAPEFLKLPMSELEAAAAFEFNLRRAGSEGCRLRAPGCEGFLGLAVSGANAGEPGFFDGAVTGLGLSSASPIGASLKPIGRNSSLMFDYTFMFNGYISDMTRIFVFGKLPPRLLRAYDAALSIHAYLAENLKPQNTGDELYRNALALAKKAGLADYFMGAPGEQAKFVGHGVGLELDELPVLAAGAETPLEAGQAVAIEPKFVFPGLGAVGIENTFIIGAAGAERITGADDEIACLP